MLLEDAWQAQRFDVATLSVPVLTAATVAAAVLAHTRLASFRLIGGVGFAMLALLGSAIMASGTLGRLAETKDGKVADVNRTNRTYGFRVADLTAAKAEQAKECRSMGPKCQQWNARVDTLTRELSDITVRSADPKIDAIVRVATLAGFDGDHAKEIVAALDPVALPLFLEAGSVLFFAAGFTRRRPATVTISSPELTVAEEIVVQPFTRSDALADLQTLRASGSQQFLAQRWGVSEPTVSKWLSTWESAGAIDRSRAGKNVRVISLGGSQLRQNKKAPRLGGRA
jgi:hypothetical protein